MKLAGFLLILGLIGLYALWIFVRPHAEHCGKCNALEVLNSKGFFHCESCGHIWWLGNRNIGIPIRYVELRVIDGTLQARCSEHVDPVADCETCVNAQKDWRNGVAL